MDKINTHRNRIDRIDEEIMALLDERFTLSKAIGDLKAESGRSVVDQHREEAILNKASTHAHERSIKEVYISLMNVSKKLQKKG